MKKKIIFVIGLAKSGGAEKRAISISKIMKTNYDTKVFAFSGKTDGVDYSFKDTYSSYKKTSLFTRVKGLRNYLIEEKPDYVFSFIPHINFFTTRALKTKELSSCKHVLALAFWRFKFPQNILLKYSFKYSDYIYYQCDEQKKLLPAKCKEIILFNPITIPEKVIPKPKYRFISVGRLEDQKNYFFQIDAFKNIKQNIPDAMLDIFGNGSQKNALMDRIEELNLSDCVTIHDYVDDINKEYQTHDCFLFTSKYEGFPNALQEAMANELICFSTFFKTGCDDLLINDITGYICHEMIPSSFAKMVCDKLTNYDKCLKVAHNGREHIAQHCNPEHFRIALTEALEKNK